MANKQSPEYIRVQELIARKLYDQRAGTADLYWDNKTTAHRQEYLDLAESFLSIKGIAIEADNQELPELLPMQTCYTEADFIKANFKKVV